MKCNEKICITEMTFKLIQNIFKEVACTLFLKCERYRLDENEKKNENLLMYPLHEKKKNHQSILNVVI